MATMQGMSGIDVRAVVAELSACIPLWIGKVYQYDSRAYGFRIKGENKAKYNLMVESGRRIHYVAELPPAPESPSGFSMYLRKYLSGGRVVDIRQYGFQRVVTIDVGKSDTVYHLVVELFDEGNIILCDKDYIILKAVRPHHFKDREVVFGVLYEYPGRDLSSLSIDEMAKMLAASDRDIVRSLASEFMLGGRHAEAVCMMAGLDKSIPAAEAEAAPVFAAYKALLERAASGKGGVITKSGCWSFALEDEEVLKSFESFSEALDAFFPMEFRKEEKKSKKLKLTREQVIRRQQEEAIKKFDKKVESSQKAVNAIYSNYALVNEVIGTLDVVSQEHSWQEIDEVLRNSNLPVAKAVLRVVPADAAVELSLDDLRVEILVHDSLEVNVNRYYGVIKKFKKKKRGALVAMERPVNKPAVKKKQFVFLKPKWFHRFRWCYTSDGVLMIGGRDAGTNEELVKKYLEGGDLFLHADVHGGSVVILKGRTSHMDEVAQFAASYSNAWKAGHFTADVYAAKPEQVSKTAESGEFVARGAFVIRGEREYFHNVSLGVAIGVQMEPSLAVIGGPVDAVKKRAKIWVVLQPGTFEPNDTARKVVRDLRAMLSEEEWKGMKMVLNSGNVAAFVPPGGSDIVVEE